MRQVVWCELPQTKSEAQTERIRGGCWAEARHKGHAQFLSGLSSSSCLRGVRPLPPPPPKPPELLLWGRSQPASKGEGEGSTGRDEILTQSCFFSMMKGGTVRPLTVLSFVHRGSNVFRDRRMRERMSHHVLFLSPV